MTSVAAALAELAERGFATSVWSNGPHARYAEHQHDYDKALICTEGSITFFLADGPYAIGSGDRLELPAGTAHSAVVGGAGVTCVEGQSPKTT